MQKGGIDERIEPAVGERFHGEQLYRQRAVAAT
jgi:hypothetical protein